jgi:hypothetical protein
MASSTFPFLQTASIFAHWPTDWFIIAAFVALVALDALRAGSARATALALALPLTSILMNALSSAFLVGSIATQFPQGGGQAVLFGIVFAILFLAIHRIVHSFAETGGTLQALIAGVSAVAVTLVVWLQVPALDTLWHFGPQVQLVFGEPYRFWWLVAAYFGLAFVRS